MSNSSIKIKINVKDNSPEVLKALQNAIERALEAIGNSAVDHATDYITEQGAVDTGRLRNSIAHKEDDEAVYLGTNVEYAPYVELGTSRMAPRPYLRPAAENHTEEYKRIVKESLENA